jgi:hypothetical protein
MAVYTTIDDPEAYFQIKAYTGTDNASQAFTLDGDTDLQPDLIWIKNRGYANKPVIFDSARGVGKSVTPSDGLAEISNNDDGGYVSAFGSDGFTLAEGGSSDNDTNDDRYTYFAFCWKESATSGVDIVEYDGTGSAHTISHSLSAVPEWYVVKELPTAGSWYMYTITSGNEQAMFLNGTNAIAEASGTYWNSTTPTSSVFSVGTSAGINQSSTGYIAYLFRSVQGFSKLSSFEGNGNADGPFIYTGFRPAWVLMKNADDASTDWNLHNNKSPGYNVNNNYIAANTTAAEVTGNAYQIIDMCANGFKIRGTGGGINESGDTIIYMAFAEAPFVNSNGVPNNAR